MAFETKELVKVAVDLYRGNVKDYGYSNAKANDSIRNAFLELMGTDKPDFRQYRRHKTEIFEIMEDVLAQTITEGFETPFFEQFVEYRDVAFGDSQYFYVEDNTPLVVAKHAGNHWDIRRQKLNIGDTFTVDTEPYAVAVYTDFQRFLAGRIDWTALVNKIRDAFAQKIQNEIYDAFIASTSYLPAEFKHTATFADADLLTLAAHVQAANQSSDVVLAGTKVALSKLTNVDYLSDGEKASRNQTGVVGIWNGYRTLPIVQSHKVGSFDFQIDEDKIFVMPSGPRPIKVVREGTPLVREISDGTTNMDQSMEYKVIENYGVSTIFNSLYGVYEIS